MEYPRPPFVTQQDGSQCASSNCWAAVGAWLAGAATNGAVTISPTKFRQISGGGSGRANKPGCNSGFEADIEKGLDRLSIRNKSLRLSPKDTKALLSKPRSAAFAIAVDYELWPPEKDCVINDFDGNHMVGILPGVDAAGRLVIENPLCKDYQKVPMHVIIEAAWKFAKNQGRTSIVLIRVPRPIPAEWPEAEAEIARLQGEIDEYSEAMLAIRTAADEFSATVHRLATTKED